MGKCVGMNRGVPAALIVAAGGLGFAALGGCNIVGPAAYFAFGEPDVQPVVTLDPQKTTVIFVDDRASKVGNLRRVIGQRAEDDIIANDAVDAQKMIQSRSIDGLLVAERFTRPMSMSEIGKSVNADVLIYVTIDQFQLSQDGTTFAPKASLRMKVIDVASGSRVYPPVTSEAEWTPLVVDVPTQARNLPSTTGGVAEANQELAKRVGRDLAMLFYKHEPLHNDATLGPSLSEGRSPTAK